MTVPVLSNVILFSVVWSLLTVLITFLGCVALRNLALDDDDYDDADDTDSAAKINSKKQAAIDIERIHLRMESHYVFAALIGICGAWILMDLVLDMPQQILPSLVMLAVALTAFTGIIYCFPEDQCLDEYAVTIDGQHEQQQQQTVVIVAVAVEEV
jgi:1,4-dihydroxy-2-naphthoate octaprenyltransferase